jgi:hydroxymethylpyrimidine/phosphomethylpyrimidine kinase
MTPTVLTIAGSDSGGGAGIQADLKTVSALGCYGTSVITAVTAQNTRSVLAVHHVPPSLIRAQIDAVLDDIAVHAIKIGMVGSAPAIVAVAAALRDCPIPIVLDPVMVAKSGDVLMEADAFGALVRELLPLAHVLTPNLPEAARLLGDAGARPAPGAHEGGSRGRRPMHRYPNRP